MSQIHIKTECLEAKYVNQTRKKLRADAKSKVFEVLDELENLYRPPEEYKVRCDARGVYFFPTAEHYIASIKWGQIKRAIGEFDAEWYGMENGDINAEMLIAQKCIGDAMQSFRRIEALAKRDAENARQAVLAQEKKP